MKISIAIVAQYALLLPALLVVLVIVRRKRWREDVVEAALGGVATIALVKVATMLRFEKRPFVVEHVQPLIPHAADNAFPSDHLAAAGLAVAYLWPRSRPLAIAALVLAAAIGAARVLALVHWPLDIAAGFILGVAGLLAGRAIAARLPFRPLQTPSAHGSSRPS